MDDMTVSLRVPTDGPFDTIAGLPVHPLVVHVAVVILPLAALGLIVLVLVPRWRATFGWLTLAGLAVGTAGAIVAKQSGEALAARVGLPQRHAELGDILPLVAALLFVLAIAWFVADRRRRASGQPDQGPALLSLGIASILVAVGTIGLTVAVGHSGAEAVWGRTAAEAAPQPSPSVPSPASTPTSTPTPTAAGPSAAPSTSPAAPEATATGPTFTLDEVAERFTPEECWTVIDGTVYDLSAWIAEHPGGGPVIESLCGIDGTAAFEAEHGGQGEPADALAQFAIGSLASG